MSERAIADPSQHGWVEVDGKWIWGASDGGGSIQDGDTEGQITTWDGTEWTPESAMTIAADGNTTIDAYELALLGTGENNLKFQQGQSSYIAADSSLYMSTAGVNRIELDTSGNVNITGKLFINGEEVGGGGGGDLWTDNGDGSISYSGIAKATDFIAE